MNTMINMNLNIEKELELEHQGFRRTRRFIGDGSQATDARWYQPSAIRLGAPDPCQAHPDLVAGNQPCPEAPRSFLDRLSQPFGTRRQSPCSEC